VRFFPTVEEDYLQEESILLKTEYSTINSFIYSNSLLITIVFGQI